MNNFVKRIMFIVLCLIVVTGCEQSKPCVDADDFGIPKVRLKGTGIDVEGPLENQVSKWRDSGLVIDGTQIIFDVYGRWFPWLAGDSSLVRDPCRYWPNQVYPYSTGATDDSGIKIIPSSQPCWLTKGMGVYGLTVQTDGSGDPNLSDIWNFKALSDPNQNLATRRNPFGNTFHMGDPNISDLWPTRTFDIESDPGGGALKQGVRLTTYDAIGKPGKTRIGDRLYFKILDTFYADNGGSVVVKIRSGARNPAPGVFERLITMVSDVILGSAETIFRRLLDPSRSDIPRAIEAMLILFVAFYGLYYTMGMVSPETTQSMFLTQIIKFAIVAVLLSGYGYEFFYEYLLVFFKEGMIEIINIVSAPFTQGTAHATDRLTFFDDVFRKLLSEETNIKIASLLWQPNPNHNWYANLNVKGLIYIPVLYVFIGFFAVALLKALLIYLMALVSIGLLIAMAPILIPFMLFSKTKAMYEGWLKSLIGTVIQPILLFAFLTMMYVVLLSTLYKTLGYRTCWDTWWTGEIGYNGSPIDIVDVSSSSNDLKAWMPNIRNKWDNILVPPFYYSNYTTGGCSGGTTNVGPGGGDKFLDVDCSLVGEQCRLVDYPSLVPPDDSNCSTTAGTPHDPNDELQLSRALSGTVTSFEDIFFFGIVIFLMYLFSERIPQLARDIGGFSHGAALEGAAGALFADAKTFGKNPLGLGSLGGAIVSRAGKVTGISKITGAATRFKHGYQDFVGGRLDKYSDKFSMRTAKRLGMKATGTYKTYKEIEKLSKEGAAIKAGFQDAIGGKLDKISKYSGLTAPAKIPLKAADKLATKAIEAATGKDIGTLSPTHWGEQAIEKVGMGAGMVEGAIRHGIGSSPEKGEEAPSLIAGSTGKITTREEMHKQADKLLNKLHGLDPVKDKAQYDRVSGELTNINRQLDSLGTPEVAKPVEETGQQGTAGGLLDDVAIKTGGPTVDEIREREQREEQRREKEELEQKIKLIKDKEKLHQAEQLSSELSLAEAELRKLDPQVAENKPRIAGLELKVRNLKSDLDKLL